MRKFIISIIFSIILASQVINAQLGPVHYTDQNLINALAQPIDFNPAVPADWVDVTTFGSFQCHWSTIDMIMQHTHLEIPAALWHREISGPVRFPFRIRTFKVHGIVDVNPIWFSGGLVTKIEFDTPNNGTLIPDPTKDVNVWTGHITIDPTVGGYQQYPAPLHGPFRVNINLLTRFDDGSTTLNHILWPMWSMVDSSAPIADPALDINAHYARQSLETCEIHGDGEGWNSQIAGFDGELPTTGTLISSFTPNFTEGYDYGTSSEIIPTLTSSSDIRRAEDLHNNIPGIILATAPTQSPSDVVCCSANIPFTFDPSQYPDGINNFTINWNISGGPTTDGMFNHFRMAGALFGIGINTSSTGVVVNPPPPVNPPPNNPPPATVITPTFIIDQNNLITICTDASQMHCSPLVAVP